MGKYVDELANARRETKTAWIVAISSGVLCTIAMLGWRTAPRDLTVHIPPALQSGATVRVGQGDVPKPNVYTFGFYIWQQVNRWAQDGQTDYGKDIFKLQNFFTPACLTQLQNDQKQRADQGELALRTRSVMEIPGLGYSDDRVEQTSDGHWSIVIDTQLIETSRGTPVKDTFIRYPLKIVRYDVDRELNPWQLAIDCYGPNDKPERLDPQAVRVAQSDPGVVKNTAAYATRSLGSGVVDVDGLPPPAAGPGPAATLATSPAVSTAPAPVAPSNNVPPAILPRTVASPSTPKDPS